MQKWEYLIEGHEIDLEGKMKLTGLRPVDYLNDLGRQGWELVSWVVYEIGLEIVMKRPVISESDRTATARFHLDSARAAISREQARLGYELIAGIETALRRAGARP